MTQRDICGYIEKHRVYKENVGLVGCTVRLAFESLTLRHGTRWTARTLLGRMVLRRLRIGVHSRAFHWLSPKKFEDKAPRTKKVLKIYFTAA